MASNTSQLARGIEGLQAALVEFIQIEAASAIVLLAITLLALGLANSPFGQTYEAALSAKLGPE